MGEKVLKLFIGSFSKSTEVFLPSWSTILWLLNSRKLCSFSECFVVLFLILWMKCLFWARLRSFTPSLEAERMSGSPFSGLNNQNQVCVALHIWESKFLFDIQGTCICAFPFSKLNKATLGESGVFQGTIFLRQSFNTAKLSPYF